MLKRVGKYRMLGAPVSGGGGSCATLDSYPAISDSVGKSVGDVVLFNGHFYRWTGAYWSNNSEVAIFTQKQATVGTMSMGSSPVPFDFKVSGDAKITVTSGTGFGNAGVFAVPQGKWLVTSSPAWQPDGNISWLTRDLDTPAWLGVAGTYIVPTSTVNAGSIFGSKAEITVGAGGMRVAIQVISSMSGFFQPGGHVTFERKA